MKLREILVAITLTASSVAAISPTYAGDGGVAGAPHVIQRDVLDRAQVRAALDARRKVTIQRFLAYRDAKVYPVNPGPDATAHVWIDRAGHLCAAATLVSLDWGRDAAINAGKADVHLKLANARTGPLADWILTSGLTRHELVAIQLPGSFVNRRPPPNVAPEPVTPSPQLAETTRMFHIYQDVERQLTALYADSLDEATDALMQHPDLARALLAGRAAGPGELDVQEHRFAKPPQKPAA
jgi:hypothetical protein